MWWLLLAGPGLGWFFGHALYSIWGIYRYEQHRKVYVRRNWMLKLGLYDTADILIGSNGIVK